MLTAWRLDLILFILVSLLVIAASLYLPNHVAVIYNRIWYYLHGEFAYMTAGSADKAAGALGATSEVLRTVSLTGQAVEASVEATLREL